MSFVQFTPRPGSSDQRVSMFDFDSLQRLKRSVASATDGQQPDPSALTNGVTDAEREVAQQFEALFIQQVLKQARRAPMSTFLQSDSSKFVQGLADQQASMELARPGVGLAQNILDMIRTQRGNPDPLAAAPLPEQVSRSRLPHLRSTVGENRREVAGSVDELISMLGTARRAAEKVHSAIDGAPGHIRDFVSRMAAAAKVASEQSGVHAKLILSQAALESGWGKREILREDGSTSHNLFGIKAGSHWKGKVVHVTTTEYVNGVPRKMKEPFRAYDSYEESFADYAKLIGDSKRYAEVVEAPTAEIAAKRIQKAGYATDPAYADKLISIMSYFDTGKKLRG